MLDIWQMVEAVNIGKDIYNSRMHYKFFKFERYTTVNSNIYYPVMRVMGNFYYSKGIQIKKVEL
jgi:hypothetical protein